MVLIGGDVVNLRNLIAYLNDGLSCRMTIALCGHCGVPNRFTTFEGANEAVCGACGEAFARCFEVTDVTFEKLVILQDRPVLVAFLNYTTEYCQEYMELVERVAATYAGYMAVAFLRADYSPETTTLLNLRQDCTTLFFAHGAEIARLQAFFHYSTEDIVRSIIGLPRLPNQEETVNLSSNNNEAALFIDVTDRVERFETFEERLGVQLESVYAKLFHNGYVEVNGELSLTKGGKLDQSIQIICALYDDAERIVSQSGATIIASNFFGFEVFQCGCLIDIVTPLRKIRLFPKPR